MKSCFRCLKFLVTFFNFLIMVLGLIIEGVFLWLYFDMTVLSDVQSHATYIIYFFIALGAVMTTLGFLGCCGAIQESQCMLGTFFFFVLVLFIGQVAVCIWSYMNFKVIEAGFQQSLKDSMKLYYWESSVQLTIDTLQQELECCGAVGPQDWQSIQPNSTGSKYELPQSCCSTQVEHCERTNILTVLIPSLSSVYAEGCSDKLFELFKSHQDVVLGVAVAMTVIQIFALIFSLILCITFGKMERYYSY